MVDYHDAVPQDPAEPGLSGCSGGSAMDRNQGDCVLLVQKRVVDHHAYNTFRGHCTIAMLWSLREWSAQ